MSKRHPTCDVVALKAFLTERLGSRIVSFNWIDTAAGTNNFVCETEAGERSIVKCVAPQNARHFQMLRDYLVPHLTTLKDIPEAVHLSHGPWTFGESLVVCLSVARGRHVRPDRLSTQQEKDLLRAYDVFSKAIQNAEPVLPCADMAHLREMVLAHLESPECRELREFVEQEIPPEVLTYDPARLRVIHGDFHYKNFHFDGPRVSGFFDFELFRWGYPAED